MKRATDVYDASYYEAYGPRDEAGQLLSPPYRRGEPHWKQFFGTIAERIIEQLSPQTVLDAGCAIGFLVEELRSRGVDARGVDVSEWGNCPSTSLTPRILPGGLPDRRVRSPLRPDHLHGVLEHLPGNEAEAIIANICRHCATVLFSSTPDDFKEPTHLNVQPTDYWIGLFAAQGFFRISTMMRHTSRPRCPAPASAWTVVEGRRGL